VKSPKPIGVAWSVLLVLSCLAATMLVTSQYGGEFTERQSASVYLAIAAASILVAARVHPGRPVSVGFVYLSLFHLFHGGIAVPVAFGLNPQFLEQASFWWIQSYYLGDAYLSAALGTAAFLAGYLSTVIMRLPSRQSASDSVPHDLPAVVPMSLLVIGCVGWAVEMAGSGVLSVEAAYSDYHTAAQGSAVPYFYLLIGVGFGMMGAVVNARWRRFGIVVFAAYAVPAFLLGLRGEVIIPLAAFIVSYACVVRVRVNWRWIILVPAFLGAGALVKVVRQEGLRSIAGMSLAEANPLHGLYELGASIRPVVLVHELLRSGDGETGPYPYYAPFTRFLSRYVFGGDYTDIRSDYGVFSTMVRAQAGGIGGSPVAEALRADVIVGVPIVLALVGVAVGVLDRVGYQRDWAFAVGAFSYPLFVWVRNDFTAVPAQTAIAIACVAAALLFGQSSSTVRSRKSSRSL
jgi:hypothetical protein